MTRVGYKDHHIMSLIEISSQLATYLLYINSSQFLTETNDVQLCSLQLSMRNINPPSDNPYMIRLIDKKLLKKLYKKIDRYKDADRLSRIGKIHELKELLREVIGIFNSFLK